MSEKIKTTKEQFLQALEKCSTRNELVEYLGLSYSTIGRRLKEYGISTFKRKFNEAEFLKLYNQNYTDSEIAKILNVNHATISDYRNKLGLVPNFSYKRDTLKKQILLLNQNDNSVDEISQKLNLDSRVVEYFLSKNEIDLKNYSISNEEFQVIIGGLLGDSSITLNRSKEQANLRYAHSEKQKEYGIWKAEKLKNLVYYETAFERQDRFDKRTNKIYPAYYVRSKEHPIFKELHTRWYSDSINSNSKIKHIKHICEEDLMQLDALGLAIWFQDDGYHEDSGYLLATLCFSKRDLQIIKKYFKDKWNIDVIIRNNGEIYISAKFRDKFKRIVEPYVHDVCKYKLLNK